MADRMAPDAGADRHGIPLDDITTFMGHLPPDEYEQRQRLRACRNAASFKVTRVECSDARALCWIVNERASAWVYTPASMEALTEIVRLCHRLLTVVDHLEEIQAKFYD